MRTITQYIVFKTYLILALLLVGTIVSAHDLEYSTFHVKGDGNINQALVLKSPRYIPNDPLLGINYVQNHTAIVALEYSREDKSDLIGREWDYTIHYNLIDKSINSSIGTGSLTISHDDEEGIYESYEIYENVSGHVQLVVTNITSSYNNGPNVSIGSIVPDDIHLILKLKEEQYDYLNPVSQSTLAMNPAIANGEAKTTARWTYMEGAEYYELEWVYWDDQNTAVLPTDEELFEEAIRAESNDTYYDIDLVYPKGTLYFRVRSIGRFVRNGVDNAIEKRGAWSDKQTVTIPDGFETNRNWQFARSYAEDGKFKQVISYFDDGLKGRQTLTNLNSENTTIVSETIYDVENRPSLAIMPVPVKNDAILGNRLQFGAGHLDNLIGDGNTGNVAYSRLDYDKHNTIGGLPQTNTLPSNHIATQYYSGVAAGPFQSIDPFENNIHRAYTPDAEGFPMAQVKYLNDGTGRMKSMSGVGETYQLNSGHESKYFYASATSTELERLFGKNIGDAKYYRKNYSVDANGQIAVSLIDHAGQTVATALAGDTPENVQELDGAETLKLESLIAPNDVAVFDVNRTSVFTHTLFCDNPQVYKFEYDLANAANVVTTGSNCVGCTYELEIEIVDELGNIIPATLSAGSGGAISGGKVISFYSGSTPCTGTSYTPSTAVVKFEVAFQEIGAYTVHKKLKVTGPDLETILIGLQTDGGILSETDFVQNYVTNNIDPTACEPCNQTQAAELATQIFILQNPNVDIHSTVVVDGVSGQSQFNDYINDLYNQNGGTLPCDDLQAQYGLMSGFSNSPEGRCAAYLGLMKQQLSPGGCLYDAGNFYTEVFITDGETPPVLEEYSSLGGPPTPLSTNPIDFVNVVQDPSRWQDQWVDDLVQYHPEYCRYLDCGNPNNDVTQSGDYLNQQIVDLETWSDAANFINYTIPTSPITDADKQNIIAFLVLNETESAYSTLGSKLNNYCTTRCAALNSSTQNSCNCNSGNSVLNFIYENIPGASTSNVVSWTNFKSIYITEKLKLKYENQCLMQHPGNFTRPSGCVEVFGPPPSAINSNTQLTTLANAGSATRCLETCEGRAIGWVEEGCPGITTAINDPNVSISLETQYNTLIGHLENYCNSGCPTTQTTITPSNPLVNPSNYLLEDDLLGDNTQVPAYPQHPDLVLAENASDDTELDNFCAANNGVGVGVDLTIPARVRTDVYNPYTSYYSTTAGTPLDPNGQKCIVIGDIINALDNDGFFPVSFANANGTPPQVTTAANFNHSTAGSAASTRLVGTPAYLTYNTPSTLSALTGLNSDPYFNWTVNGIALYNEHIYDNTFGNLEDVNNFIQITGTNFCNGCNPSNNCNDLGLEFITTGGESVNPLQILSLGAYDCQTNSLEIEIVDGTCAFANNSDGTGTACTGTLTTKTIPVFVRVNNQIGTTSCVPEWEESYGWIPKNDDMQVDPDLALQWCLETQAQLLEAEALAAYNDYVTYTLNQILLEDQCFDIEETFIVEFTSTEKQYTLFYYDQAGDLVQTIPPVAVNPLTAADFTNGKLNLGAHPAHDLTQATQYQYNNLGQVTVSVSPDGGESHFYYDYAQRLRLSQNARQAPVANDPTSYGMGGDYAYTKFDHQGRIIEVGRLENYVVDPIDLNKISFPSSANQTLSEQTNTEYDKASIFGTLTQNESNLRSRVSRVYNEHIATYYDYDIHGNVKKMQHQIEDFGAIEIDYDYDLITGNVNEVGYQRGTAEEYFHRYQYDADNRLTKVFTSQKGHIWANEARYFYYAHGPLARVEIGQDKVQGMDYYYNLQGWLKGVNTPQTATDPGLDGYTTELGNGATNPNLWHGKDEYAFHLGYHREDYKPIGGVGKMGILRNSATTIFDNDILSGSNPVKGLFNGNIAFMVTHLPKLATAPDPGSATNAAVYQYDALHRIKQSRTYHHDGDVWQRDAIGERYDTDYTYDTNGNLQTLLRYAKGYTDPIDNLEYSYNTANNKPNQLLQVTDNAGTNALANDLETQTANNYIYDATGSLSSDLSQSISNIQWNLMNKIDRVTRTPGAGGVIDYTYDIAGSRLTKTTYDGDIATTTMYIKDAGGNIMATYEREVTDNNNGTFSYKKAITEVMLYGASRLGVRQFDKNWVNYNEITAEPKEMSEALVILAQSQYAEIGTRGDKLYEGSNHLGNVLITFSDKKVGRIGNGVGIAASYYEAIVNSTNDYYPFGWTMPGRSIQSGGQGYKFGFNGQIQDEEWNGGQSVNYTFRVQDARLGRFLSVDPLAPSYPELTPYQFAGNTPIWATDLEGAEAEPQQTQGPNTLGNDNVETAATPGADGMFVETLPEAIVDSKRGNGFFRKIMRKANVPEYTINQRLNNELYMSEINEAFNNGYDDYANRMLSKQPLDGSAYDGSEYTKGLRKTVLWGIGGPLVASGITIMAPATTSTFVQNGLYQGGINGTISFTSSAWTHGSIEEGLINTDLADIGIGFFAGGISKGWSMFGSFGNVLFVANYDYSFNNDFSSGGLLPSFGGKTKSAGETYTDLLIGMVGHSFTLGALYSEFALTTNAALYQQRFVFAERLTATLSPFIGDRIKYNISSNGYSSQRRIPNNITIYNYKNK
jgi:RHS repeat-associated protein